MLLILLRQVLIIVLVSSSLLFIPTVRAGVQTLRTKGDWYGFWGWNRATYSDSDIHFKGDDHDFMLNNVEAKDRQTDVNIHNLVTRYFNPTQLTIPQYDWRIGYFVADNWAVSLGFDHMKYVMVQDQTVDMTGTISRPGFEQSDPARRKQVLTDDFLTYEHTDGFNMISLETEKFFPIWSGSTGMDVAFFAGAGAGVLYPKSNVRLLSGKRNDEWHVAGYATSVKVGLETTLWKGLFFRLTGKYGHADMDDVLTSNSGDKADQTFYFDEYIAAVGYRF